MSIGGRVVLAVIGTAGTAIYIYRAAKIRNDALRGKGEYRVAVVVAVLVGIGAVYVTVS